MTRQHPHSAQEHSYGDGAVRWVPPFRPPRRRDPVHLLLCEALIEKIRQLPSNELDLVREYIALWHEVRAW